MSLLNDLIERQLRTVRQDARMRPIVDRAKQSCDGRCSSDALLGPVMREARDSFIREGKQPESYQVRERAFLAAAAAATEEPMVLSDIPPGADRTQHYFASGLIAIKAAGFFDWFLPRTWAERLGVATSVAVGWLKEVYDQFFGSGYDKGDLAADIAGAKRPFQVRADAIRVTR